MHRFLWLAVLILVACGGAQEAAPPPVEDPPVVESGVARFGQSEIYYELAGEGEPTVILLHGGMLDCHMWDGQFELLARTNRVLRYDASAQGNSSLPPD